MQVISNAWSDFNAKNSLDRRSWMAGSHRYRSGFWTKRFIRNAWLDWKTALRCCRSPLSRLVANQEDRFHYRSVDFGRQGLSRREGAKRRHDLLLVAES